MAARRVDRSATAAKIDLIGTTVTTVRDDVRPRTRVNGVMLQVGERIVAADIVDRVVSATAMDGIGAALQLNEIGSLPASMEFTPPNALIVS